MNILAFSDLHRDKKATRAIVDASAQADILIGAGDFANCGVGLADCIEILKTSAAPVILVPGNHESHDELVASCAGAPDITVLHGTAISVRGVRFFGLGYEIPSRNEADWNQTLTEQAAGKLFGVAAPFDILVTHTPPYGCADLQRNGEREGSEAIADALHAHNPKLHLCGHIHYSWGAEGYVGETYVKNLGPTLNWFEV